MNIKIIMINCQKLRPHPAIRRLFHKPDFPLSGQSQPSENFYNVKPFKIFYPAAGNNFTTRLYLSNVNMIGFKKASWLLPSIFASWYTGLRPPGTNPIKQVMRFHRAPLHLLDRA